VSVERRRGVERTGREAETVRRRRCREGTRNNDMTGAQFEECGTDHVDRVGRRRAEGTDVETG
jgi:hypothetical protein